MLRAFNTVVRLLVFSICLLGGVRGCGRLLAFCSFFYVFGSGLWVGCGLETVEGEGVKKEACRAEGKGGHFDLF